ncbi:hypothetical protein HHK36_001019 [Tetracentron sinense]|uniref:RRM domain-containing protein n=1 Tax=Tetracentron sinense TaxID=13715 RepID=A0A834ZSZ4_TETSI|nr:hypothetical protein HHK36_001019 [Tetracentron sinense]
MPPRSSNRRGASATKKSPALPKTRKSTPKSKQQAVPLIDDEENRVPESGILSNTVEEDKIQELVPSVAVEEKEIKQEEEVSGPSIDEEKEIQQDTEVLTTNASEVKEESLSDGEEKAVIREEVLVTTVVEETITEEVSVTTVTVEETNVMEEAFGEENPDIVLENLSEMNTMCIEKGENDSDEESPDEMNSGESENGEEDENDGAHMDLDQGAKEDIVEEETAAAVIDDTKGGGDGNDTPGANEGATGEGEGEKSGDDEEDDEEDGDPSAFTHAPFTDRKKEKDFEIFVGGLDKQAVEEDLIKVFGKFGEIQATRIVKHPTTQKSKGFAFIRYATVEQAKKVLAELKDGTEVLETLKSFGIEQIEDMQFPDDPKIQGKSKGFALLEFSTHSDAMAAFQRLRKPDAVFGCDRSATVAFAQTPIRPSEEALSQVKTVYLEGLTDSWDEERVKEFCKQYGEIENVQLSRNLVTKRNDFAFVAFTSRESAVACVEGINNAQIGEGDIKVKANLAKPQNKGRLQKQGARGGFKVKEGEKTEEAGPSKMKGHAKSKEAERKGKALPKLKTAKGGKPNKPQHSVAEGQRAGVPSRSERTNWQRKELPAKGEKRSRRDLNTGHSKRPSKKPRGNIRDRPSSGFGNQRYNSHSRKARPNYSAASATYGNPYAHGYVASASSYQGHAYGAVSGSHAYGAVSGSKQHYSDMEPHAGYLEPAAVQGQNPPGYGLRRAGGHEGQGSRVAAYGGGLGGGYHPSSAAYPPRPAYYYN